MVSATIVGESGEQCSDNFVHLYGSSGSSGLQYSLIKQNAQSGNMWLRTPLYDTSSQYAGTPPSPTTLTFLTNDQYINLSYQFGCLCVQNLLLLPVPNFSGSATESFALANLNNPANDSAFVCTWTGYLNVPAKSKWFCMSLENVDDQLRVEVVDARNAQTQLFSWTFPIASPTTSPNPTTQYYEFQYPGLYPILIQFYNAQGPTGISGLTIGFWGDNPMATSQLYTQSTPFYGNEWIMNPTFPGVTSGTWSTTATGLVQSTGSMDATRMYRTDIIVSDVNGTQPVTEYINPGLSSTEATVNETITNPNNKKQTIPFPVSYPTPNQQWNPFPDSLFKCSNISFSLNNLFGGMSFQPGKHYSLHLELLSIPSVPS